MEVKHCLCSLELIVLMTWSIEIQFLCFREIQILKKDQDRYNRGELKMLGKEYRNKGELQRYAMSRFFL